MAKKSGRRRSKARAPARQPAASVERRPAATRAASVQRRPAATRPESVSASSTAAKRPTDLAREYRYVLNDLRRIGLLAAAMFVLLVVLALAAQYIL